MFKENNVTNKIPCTVTLYFYSIDFYKNRLKFPFYTVTFAFDSIIVFLYLPI